jgi:hypothetical protein
MERPSTLDGNDLSSASAAKADPIAEKSRSVIDTRRPIGDRSAHAASNRAAAGSTYQNTAELIRAVRFPGTMMK